MTVNRKADPPSRQAAQSAATRAELVATARQRFGAQGYAGVGTEEIVRAAGMTRGALYHHFADKRDLFAAVYEDLERELVEELGAIAAGARDPAHALRLGAGAFLDACLDPATQRIVLIDAPAVLGYERWREIAERYGLGIIEATLAAAVEAGQLPPQPVKPLAHMLLGALDEAGLFVARADDVAAARAEVGRSLDRLLDALLARPPAGRGRRAARRR